MMSESKRPPGRIITFYSYKGGTGRSMALANVAWILAANSKRVLMIDWDLEAPGLHRYFAPLLKDPEAANSLGLMNFLLEFVLAAKRGEPGSDPEWYEEYTNLLLYARAVQWDFGERGALHLVAAGRQDAGYGQLVNGFDWRSFYEELGGGIFLEAVKRVLRDNYDYILIDSRTGLSDTSGICSVQMPDDLVVCFTLNNQSVNGAAAVAAGAYDLRLTPDRLPGLTVWPVPMRVEAAESEKMWTSLKYAEDRFRRFMMHLPREDRKQYWAGVAVPYRPYFAYEEVLAIFAEQQTPTLSLLAPMHAIARWTSHDPSIEFPTIPDPLRSATLQRFIRRPDAGGKFFVCYDRNAFAEAARLIGSIAGQFGDQRVAASRDLLSTFEMAGVAAAEYPFKAPAWTSDLTALYTADAIIALVGPHWALEDPDFDPVMLRELEIAATKGLPVVAVRIGGAGYPRLRRLPPALQPLFKEETLLVPAGYSEDRLDELWSACQRALNAAARRSAGSLDPDDPQKGQWGGSPTRNGRALSASVSEAGRGFFAVELRVAADQELSTLRGHSAGVRAVAVLPSGRRALSASVDRSLKLWDLESGECLRTLEEHDRGLRAVAVSPDGRRAVSAGSDQSLVCWDLESGRPLRTMNGHTDSVTGLVFAPDGGRIVSCSMDKTLRLWDASSGRELRTIDAQDSAVRAIAHCPDGLRAVSASEDGSLRVWDLETGQLLATLQGHTRGVVSVAVTPDGRHVLSGSQDSTLKFWDLESAALIRTLEGHAGCVYGVAIAPGGLRAVSASWDRTLIHWDLASGQPLGTLTGHDEAVRAVAVTPDGGKAVSACWDSTLKVWDLDVRPLEGAVRFFLHPTFTPETVEVAAERGVARLPLHAYGAFTVGATADDGFTCLELDLAADPSFPIEFRLH